MPPAFVHTTEPLTFWSLPSMMTLVPAAPPLLADALVLELLAELLGADLLPLEQPETPSARIAAPATAIVS
ncbi:hypothetical protein L839_3078 [Mycobacterium avium MAV_120809_2495]|nr:hypothetical protein L839_3078 [Mycobacterium avium MAV_120809_2495]